MEEITLSVQVNVLLKDGKASFSIMRNRDDLDLNKMREILMGGMSLLIKAEEGPEKQGEAIRDVIDRLQQEFVDVDSFNDIFYQKPKN